MAVGQRKGIPVATVLLLCYSVAQLATSGWWLVQQAGQSTCKVDNEGAWSIGVYKGPSPFSLQPLERAEPQEFTSVSWPVANPVLTCASVDDSPSSFVADPFLWQHQGELYMFYESKSVAKGRGEIGVARSSDSGVSWQHMGIALSERWHLSYPFVFEHQGQVYMMPEVSASGQLRLYRARSFPLSWELDRVLLDRPLVDASLVEFEGRWWMFASDATRRGARLNGELEVWHAESPLGPWQQHASNPVMNGGSELGARSGGRPLVFEGRLYRFGQDCGDTYGHQVVTYEVTKLTPTEFEQVPVQLGVGRPADASTSGSSSSSSRSKKPAWNSRRQHHIDMQQLPSGEWVAAMDGDRVESGAVSRQLLRRAALAAGPWVALLAAWGAMCVAARYSPAARRLLFAVRTSPLAVPLIKVPPLKMMTIMNAQHKRDDDSDDIELQQHGGGGRLEAGLGGCGGGGSIKAEGGLQQPPRGASAAARLWWTRRWPSLSQRRAGGGGARAAASSKGEVLQALRAGRSLLRGSTLQAQVWLLLGVLPVLAAVCGAVGGALYLRPYFLPARALAVGGQFSQFTLVSMSYEARMPTLRHMVRHYSRCPSVAEIVLVWNKGRPPLPERDFDSAVPVRVRVEPVNSLNNRFKVDPLIKTRAVLSLDDDIMMPCSDIELGFAAWRQQPEKMVGFYPRLIEGDPLEFRGERYSIERGAYNAVLTGAAFLDTWTAFPAYWSEAVQPARDTVDEVFNGEDLLMNFVLANRTHHLLAAMAGGGGLGGAGEGRGMRRRQQEVAPATGTAARGGRQGDGGGGGEDGEGRGPLDSAVVFIPPTRRVDISKLSGVGISHNFERFKQTAAHYLANFTTTFGYMPLEAQPHNWDNSRPPFCALNWLGCTYLN